MILISQIVEGILMTYRDSSTCLVDMHLRTSDIQELLRDYPELAARDFGWGNAAGGCICGVYTRHSGFIQASQQANQERVAG